jgi:hypothetical protein
MTEKKKKQELPNYFIIKKVMYLILTALTLLFSTCAGRDAVSAIVSGKNESVGYVVPAVVFGVISFLCYLGFRKYSERVDELFGYKKPKKEEPKKDVEEK